MAQENQGNSNRDSQQNQGSSQGSRQGQQKQGSQQGTGQQDQNQASRQGQQNQGSGQQGGDQQGQGQQRQGHGYAETLQNCAPREVLPGDVGHLFVSRAGPLRGTRPTGYQLPGCANGCRLRLLDPHLERRAFDHT